MKRKIVLWLLVATFSVPLAQAQGQVAATQAGAAATAQGWRELRRIPVPAEYPKLTAITLSADGKRVAYVGRWFAEDSAAGTTTFTGKAALFVDEAKYSSDFYAIHSPIFSPDGKHVAYVTVTPVDNKLSASGWKLFLDTTQLADRVMPGAPVFSPDGSRLAYLVDTSQSIFKPRMALHVNGTLFSEVPERYMPMAMADDFEMDAEPILSFSPDGSAIAFTARVGKKCAVMVNDKDVAPDLDMVGPPKLATDGRVVYQAKKKGDWSLMVGGTKVTADFDRIGKPVLSRDGSALAYRARTGKKWAVYINTTKVTPDLEKIGPIALSRDGRKVAYPARVDGTWTVFIQDTRLPVEFQIPKLGYDGIRGFAFNADGSRVVYKYESFEDQAHLYAGITGTSYLMINATRVTPDFTTLDFVVLDGTTIVVAGHDAARHEIVMGSIEF